MKIKQVVTEKNELGFGDESKMLAHFDSSVNQNSDSRIRTIFYLFDFSCKNSKVSIETLLDEIKPIVIEKFETENRHQSMKKIRLFGVTRL